MYIDYSFNEPQFVKTKMKINEIIKNLKQTTCTYVFCFQTSNNQ